MNQSEYKPQSNGCLAFLGISLIFIIIYTLVEAISRLLRSASNDIDKYHKRNPSDTITGSIMNHYFPRNTTPPQGLPEGKTEDRLDLDSFPFQKHEREILPREDFNDG